MLFSFTQRRVLVASLGLRCEFPSWINWPVRIWRYLLRCALRTNQTWSAIEPDAAARPILVALLGLRCGLPSWINRPVRIGRYLLASVESKNGKRNKPNMINDWS